MADLKISQLTAAASAASADLFNIVQGGVNKKLTTANLFANVNSPVIINPDLQDIDTRVAGTTKNFLLYAQASTDRVAIGTNTPEEILDVDSGNVKLSGGYLRLAYSESVAGNGTLAISTDHAVSKMETTGSGQSTSILGAGVDGQIKIVVLEAKAAGTSLVLSTASSAGFSNITFDNPGETVTLQYLANTSGVGGKWYILATRGTTIV